ncbi:hypothetical protein [Neptunomonas sp. XY-337]|uniref:hypothetical protein n=1 Tax=Neptunomonas sp. XY-337 TaxID=2561897 RepID=UPI0010AB18AA|nr:hypothetical protein [Neptunomonas sp. XY-337]
MSLSRIEWGAIASVISGAVWLGTLQGTLNNLDPKEIKEETNKSVLAIRNVTSELSRSLENNSITTNLESITYEKCGNSGSTGLRCEKTCPKGSVLVGLNFGGDDGGGGEIAYIHLKCAPLIVNSSPK